MFWLHADEPDFTGGGIPPLHADDLLATPLGELAATGRSFEIRVIDVLTVDHGLVTAVTVVADELAQLTAPGAVRPRQEPES